MLLQFLCHGGGAREPPADPNERWWLCTSQLHLQTAVVGRKVSGDPGPFKEEEDAAACRRRPGCRIRDVQGSRRVSPCPGQLPPSVPSLCPVSRALCSHVQAGKLLPGNRATSGVKYSTCVPWGKALTCGSSSDGDPAASAWRESHGATRSPTARNSVRGRVQALISLRIFF